MTLIFTISSVFGCCQFLRDISGSLASKSGTLFSHFANGNWPAAAEHNVSRVERMNQNSSVVELTAG